MQNYHFRGCTQMSIPYDDGFGIHKPGFFTGSKRNSIFFVKISLGLILQLPLCQT